MSKHPSKPHSKGTKAPKSGFHPVETAFQGHSRPQSSRARSDLPLRNANYGSSSKPRSKSKEGGFGGLLRCIFGGCNKPKPSSTRRTAQSTRPPPSSATPKRSGSRRRKEPLKDNKEQISYPLGPASVANGVAADNVSYPPKAKTAAERAAMTERIGRGFNSNATRQDSVKELKSKAKKAGRGMAPKVQSVHGAIHDVNDPRPVTRWPGGVVPSPVLRGDPLPTRPHRPDETPPLPPVPLRVTSTYSGPRSKSEGCMICHRLDIMTNKLCVTCNSLGLKPKDAPPLPPSPPPPARSRTHSRARAGPSTSPAPSTPGSTPGVAPLGIPTRSRAFNDPDEIHPAVRDSYMAKMNTEQEDYTTPPRKLQEATSNVYGSRYTGPALRWLSSKSKSKSRSPGSTSGYAPPRAGSAWGSRPNDHEPSTSPSRLSRPFIPNTPHSEANHSDARLSRPFLPVTPDPNHRLPSPPPVNRSATRAKDTRTKDKKGKGRATPPITPDSRPISPLSRSGTPMSSSSSLASALHSPPPLMSRSDTAFSSRTSSSSSPSTSTSNSHSRSRSPAPALGQTKEISSRIQSVWEDDIPSPHASAMGSPIFIGGEYGLLDRSRFDRSRSPPGMSGVGSPSSVYSRNTMGLMADVAGMPGNWGDWEMGRGYVDVLGSALGTPGGKKGGWGGMGDRDSEKPPVPEIPEEWASCVGVGVGKKGTGGDKGKGEKGKEERRGWERERERERKEVVGLGIDTSGGGGRF